ncbi:adenylate/guanylate cyclase domain-containing protein [Phaeobacter gallaeciensis]|uniref:Adenylate/guanylate cyclase domain-containing protein n=1 Tax=Phaeobacter gallaeciensis TaxID=60890 RepID=A0ABD4XAX6_9RHOB|nr:adenylate/guanylate cyclase domain-containing protein [Phaeobacter gallaeciensis]MDE4145346.1 adenylate/guanylate cyclase domain-containing protein [Phaeobacter gallaeciensis]MDE4158017.1 adenylate/guanylate cyclase domain-containing protein [Phaeobacter gallaeciensis]MDE4162196.1 adenylate/guanylate cyclase domain-containing protein [Phaeobacter gallaeciensis]MDE4166422.1 adenylate/guanylate cyclase domain-containing protein [Phaeobacter gallaeciensis]MDE4170635.1 adenylate/guanylate cycla
MTHVLWQGNWIIRTRMVTGLILFTYVFFHFINLGLALFSPAAVEAMQSARQVITRSVLGGVVLYSALILHAGLALWQLTRRRSWRMTWNEAVQLGLGLLIPLQLLRHITYTRYAHELHNVNDEMGFILVLMWNSPSIWWQALLLLAVWIHGCMGLHYWLRLTRWWRRTQTYMIGLSVFIPTFALAGALSEGRRIYDLFVEGSQRAALMASYNWPDQPTFISLRENENLWIGLFLALLVLTGTAVLLQKALRKRRAVRITYVNGPVVSAEKGLTLLEMSRASGVPHTSLCGGKGRCTTCRVVVEDGLDALHPPSDAEARSLAAVRASSTMRLACQIRPTAPLTVCRMFRPDGRTTRAHASQGQERRLAILFLDIRGFTSRTEGQLPYDVVFLLNRFFDAIVPAITGAGGHVDKYLGDGLLAVFDAPSPAHSARAALNAAAAIGTALRTFNARLEEEDSSPVRIGIGLHLGDLVQGEIGSADHAPRTIIGDSVNAASRLEAETKALGVELLVSAAVLDASGFAAPESALQSFQLRGVAEPVTAIAALRAEDLFDLLTAQHEQHHNQHA